MNAAVGPAVVEIRRVIKATPGTAVFLVDEKMPVDKVSAQ